MKCFSEGEKFLYLGAVNGGSSHQFSFRWYQTNFWSNKSKAEDNWSSRSYISKAQILVRLP